MFGGIRQLFRAAKAILCRKNDDAPRPQERRRRGDTDKGAVAVCRTMLHRLARTGAAARGRYAALRPAREPQEPITLAPEAYEAATVSTATTFEWLMNMWDANIGMEVNSALDDSFDTKQNHYYPQP